MPPTTPPLPLSFQLLPTSLSSPRLTPFLTVTLNGVTLYRTLDPEPREPFFSASLLLLSQGLPSLAALTRYGCQLPLGYDTTLSGLSPFPEIWVPLLKAREMAADLGVMDQLAWLLSWRTRAMASWLVDGGTSGADGGGGVVGHNWRLPGDRADPSSYSHQTLISSPITSNIVMLPEDQTILTLLSPSHLTALLTSPAPSAIPPSAYSDLWHPLVTLTTEAYESYASPSDVEPTSSTVLASLLMPFLDGPIGSAFPAVDKDELVKMLGGRRGLSEEGRKVVAKGVEVIGGLMVRAIMGGGSEGVEKELRPSEADQRADESQAATVFVLPSSSEVKRNRRQDQTTTRRRSPSSSSTSTPSIAAEPRPSPAPDHITPHLTQISSQIDRLSREIAALAAALPPPVAPAPPPQQEPASPPASRMVSPPLSPSPFFHTSPHLAILAIASVLVGSVCLLLSSLHHPPPPFSNGLASCPLPASPPALDFELISAKDTVRANRAWVLKTVADYAEEAALPRRPDEGHVGQKDQAEADPDRRSRTKRDR